jgi:predicted KAP-like P-loop ATPase
VIGVAPKDELEGMLAAQVIAAHNAAMECYRRAMIREQTLEGRQQSLSQESKLSRASAALIEALNRRRGKGQQKVTLSTSTSIPADRRLWAWSHRPRV